MSLSNLPKEILLEIADYLDDAGMNSLVRTNSNVYYLLNVLLYRRDLKRQISGRTSLVWAIANGVEGTVQRAVDACRCLNPIPETFHIALRIAVKQGHVSIVRQLLAREDIDCNTLRSGLAPLTTACEYGHVEIVNLLLDRDDIDVNYRGGRSTPLITAVEMGFVEGVESLLARDDLKPNIVNNCGDHVLGQAVSRGKVDIVKLLLDHPGIDINFMAGDGLITALMLARQPDMLKLLLEQEGIEVNRQDDLGFTALCKAACFGQPEIVKLLLEREDININLPNHLGETPLFWEVRRNCLELVDLLLKKDDINPNPKVIYSGRTPLAQACHFGGSTAIVRSLLSHPDTDPNAVDSNGVSILAGFMNFRHLMTDSLQADEIELLLRTAGAR